ncbi:Rieske 2Fe-2S domain-containing protein [Amphritea sp. 1_MG-2023]|uniref:Rieske (2Fe-2S) protein n=1 Tax=Amphritea sp. 1_MG-2023 TaxID=3062670 RepID=UPI0026E26435|nr:Rieske 2Fe-2S domain-containing protein [Amphritea sp. 1_MG-2023]MDO6563904.1 Rieske 2Fe-2S domain-containing protein [Amphritea sp. 1_MG-2023]
MTTITPLILISELPENSTKGIKLGERNLFAVNHQGKLYLYENRCPHKGIPLEWMPDTFLDVEKQFIQCATHGALFTIDEGLCIAGPCTGATLTSIEFVIIEGQICLASASETHR